MYVSRKTSMLSRKAMSGGRFFVFLVCAFGVASSFLPWAADRYMGHEESGLRLWFGAACMLGFIAAMAGVHVTRTSRSPTTIRVLCGALSGGLLLIDVVFRIFCSWVWRAVAMNDYVLFDDERGRPTIGWYVSVASSLVLAGCAIVPRLWRRAR